MFYAIFILVSIAIYSWACDIYIANKCPSAPAYTEVNFNYTAYCLETKEHVDCINKKLKMCKKVQEYGPALETIKWTLKVVIKEARENHGCKNISDKIKLPRIPRKKLTTTTKKPIETDEPLVYIDPNCNKNLADMSCEKLEPVLMKYLFDDSQADFSTNLTSYLNDFTCKNILKYNQCLQFNFKIKCSQTLAQTFGKLERITIKCSTFSQQNNKILMRRNNALSYRTKLGKLSSNKILYIFLIYISHAKFFTKLNIISKL